MKAEIKWVNVKRFIIDLSEEEYDRLYKTVADAVELRGPVNPDNELSALFNEMPLPP